MTKEKKIETRTRAKFHCKIQSDVINTSIEFNMESSGAGSAPCHFSHGFHETMFNYRVIMYYSPKGGGIATDSSNI